MEALKPPATVSFTTGNTAEQWRRWEQQFRFYFAAAELSKKTAKTQSQVAVLLHCAGPEAQDIYTNFVFANTDDDKDSNWEHVLKKFRDYCEPRKNEVFERYKFWQRDQREGKTIDQWVNDLRILLSSCEYEDQKQSNLRDRIVFGVADIRVKERLLCESDLNLAKELDICHAAEASKVQMKVMEGDSQQRHEVNIFSKKNTGKSHRRENNPAEASAVSHKQHTQFYQGRNYGYCGSQHPPCKCPALVQPVLNAKDGTTLQRWAKVQEENLPTRDRSH